VGGVVEVDSETVFDSTSAAEPSTLGLGNDAVVLDIPTTGERVFVFRTPLEPQNTLGATNRKRKKRNFLNLKNGSVEFVGGFRRPTLSLLVRVGRLKIGHRISSGYRRFLLVLYCTPSLVPDLFGVTRNK
jgi:hypothetical protein